MALVNTNIKIDCALKQESQELFESFGLSLSSAINMFLRQSVREQAIPFRVGASKQRNHKSYRRCKEGDWVESRLCLH